MWGPRYGHYGYGRRRYDYDYWWHAPRAFFTVIPLLQAAQEHLTTAATPVTLALLTTTLVFSYLDRQLLASLFEPIKKGASASSRLPRLS